MCKCVTCDNILTYAQIHCKCASAFRKSAKLYDVMCVRECVVEVGMEVGGTKRVLLTRLNS